MTRKKLLGLLLLLLAAALAYAYWGSPRQERAERGREPLARNQPKGTDQSAVQGEGVRRVRLELLQEDAAAFPGYKRNIFGSIAPPPPPPPRPVPVPVTSPPLQRPEMPSTPPPPMQPELARFTFLGYLERDGAKRIFLSGDNELYVVGKDDRFGKNQRFQVVSLTADRLVLRQGDDPRDIVITLVERSPLAMESSPFRRGAPAGREFPPPRRTGSLIGSRPLPPEEEPAVPPDAAGELPAAGVPVLPPGAAPPGAGSPVGSSPFASDSPLRSISSDSSPQAPAAGANEVKP